MTCLSRSAPLRGGNYVCDTCRNSLRSLRCTRFDTTRTLSIASPPSRNFITRQALLQSRRQRAISQLPSTVPNGRFERQRLYSTVESTPQPFSPGIALLPHRRLISLSGPDAAKFLQGLTTNNVDPSIQSSFYSAFLDARGRVLWDVFIWVWPELVAEKGHWACYIEVDEAEAEALRKHLKRHKLRSDIKIEGVRAEGDGGVRVWAAWGSAGATLSSDAVVTQLDDPRAPDMRRYLARADVEPIAEESEPLGVGAYRVQRYKHGIAEGPLEIPRESALPMECNIDLSRGIDFKKGCYVGQELTIRTKHTGVVRKRILPVRIYDNTASDSLPTHGAEIKQLDENGMMKKGRAAGKFIAGIDNVGLALCRLEMMTGMKGSAEGGGWKPGMEFGIETDTKIVKILPVLYDWFVLRERELWDKNRARI